MKKLIIYLGTLAGIGSLMFLAWFLFQIRQSFGQIFGYQAFNWFVVIPTTLIISMLAILIVSAIGWAIALLFKSGLVFWSSLSATMAGNKMHEAFSNFGKDRIGDMWQTVLIQLQLGYTRVKEIGSLEFQEESGSKGLSVREAMQLAERMSQPGTQPAQLANRPELIPTIANMDCLLFVGPRGRAKTTNMLRLMEARKGRELPIVFDTHAAPNKWPDASIVHGSNPNLTEEQRHAYIWVEMMKIVAEIYQRKNQYLSGEVKEGQFQAKTIYIDEFTSLPGRLDSYGYNIQDFTFPVLDEGRKVNFNFVWGSHADTAKSLGSAGRAKSIKESFDALAYLKKTPDDRYALLDFGEGLDKKTHYTLAPPFPQGSVSGSQDNDFNGQVIEPEFDNTAEADGRSGKAKITPETVEAAWLKCQETGIENPTLADLSRELGVSVSSKNNARIREFSRQLGHDKMD